MGFGGWLLVGSILIGCGWLASHDAHRLLNHPDPATAPWRWLRFVAALGLAASLLFSTVRAGSTPRADRKEVAWTDRLIAIPWLGALSALALVVGTAALSARRGYRRLARDVDAFGSIDPTKRQPLSPAELRALSTPEPEPKPNDETSTTP